MSAKIFIEMGEPKRAILVMDTIDILECKATTVDFHYDKYGNPTTISGEIRVKDLPWERLNPGGISILKNNIEFPDLKTAEELMDKIHKIVPDMLPPKPDDVQKEIVDIEIKHVEEQAKADEAAAYNKIVKGPVNDHGLKEVSTNVYEIENVDAVVKEMKATEKQPSKTIKSLADLPAAMKQQQKVAGKEEQNKNRPNEPRPNVKPVPDVSKASTKQNQQQSYGKHKKGGQPQNNASRDASNGKKAEVKDLGFKKTLLSEYPDGFILGYKFMATTKEGPEEQLLIVSTPRIGSNYDTSLPMVFSNETTAKFVLDALLRHPKHFKVVGKAGVIPVSDLRKEDLAMEVALITNGLTYVNSLDHK